MKKNKEKGRNEMTGVIKFFNRVKGYGFIRGDDGKETFVHISNISATNGQYPEENQRVSYEIGQCAKGEMAIDVILM